MIEANGQVYPAPIDRVNEVAPRTYDLWARAVRWSTLSLMRARFVDLLWGAKFGGRPYEFAQVAIDSYIAATTDVAQMEASLLIHCACHLRLLEPADRFPEDNAGVDQDP